MPPERRAPTVSVVLPTYNRLDALTETFPRLLEVELVTEIIVVDDGSTDSTATYIGAQPDRRVKLLCHQGRRGSPAARNTGVAAAFSEWILFAEDDCVLPQDYAAILIAEAKSVDADIVGAPWLRCAPGEEQIAVANARARVVSTIGLRTHPGTMPAGRVSTPFLPALALVRRTVFDRVGFDEGYRGNAYREETDFFVSAARAGFRCVLTPATAHFQHRIWSGGQRRGRLAYERSALQNNWRFLRRHGRWLHENGHIQRPALEQMRFLASRTGALARGITVRRYRQIVSRL